jgi:sulfide dehydrogenase [flavocytochrome c] flavoprotein subunit
MDPNLKVTLVEPRRSYFTYPFSNQVLGGMKTMEELTYSYKKLQRKYGINVIHVAAARINAVSKTVLLQDGKSLTFDRIIVAPGIDMRFDQIENYKPEDTDFIPHAWKGRSATLRLLQQLESMPNGGMVLICPPALPYRCPPAPYERASLVAHYLSQHKPRSKILILDAKEQFPKQALFSAGWKSLYGRMIEWFNGSAGGLILRADAKNMTVETEFGIEKGDVINLIPAQWAGRIARASGLSDESGWCPVDQLTFESTLLPGIHVIGDAAIAGVMPKSGFSANNQAKVTAAAVIALLKEKEPTSYPISNTCYSFLAPDYAIYVTAEYQLSGRELVKIKGSGGVSPLNVDLSVRHSEAVSAQRWYDSITQDMFG